MIDTNKAIRLILIADTALITTVPVTQIQVGPVRSGTTLPAVTLENVGGETDENLPLISPTVQIRCWSESSLEEARLVYRLVHDALHDKRGVDLGADGFLLNAREAVHGQDLVDPETRWPNVLSVFQFIFRKD
jgi:hypothetical protein